jgi:hypothetical protein
MPFTLLSNHGRWQLVIASMIVEKIAKAISTIPSVESSFIAVAKEIIHKVRGNIRGQHFFILPSKAQDARRATDS